MSFYYPDASDLNKVIIGFDVKSLEECREIIAMNRKTSISDPSKLDDYECGKNCKQDKKTELWICDETIE